MIKPMPKNQSKIENIINALITQLISILEEDWEENQVSTFLISSQSIEETVSNDDK